MAVRPNSISPVPDHSIKFIIVDLFCGAGGTTSGFSWATVDGKPIAKVIACVNHDPLAIRSHAANFPECVHFQEDVRNMDFQHLAAVVDAAHKRYPKARLILWASLECTHFSGAKTGSRDADSRTLAHSLYDYVQVLRPDFVQIENVREFQSWGPLTARVVKAKGETGQHCSLTWDKKQKRLTGIFVPENRKKGIDYIKWRQHMESFGYRYASKLINSADHGAYQSRLRYFAVFAAGDLPVVFPQPTHDRKGRHGLPLWKAVKDVLDLDEVGDSIFDRKKPLSDNTLRRILAGLLKFAGNPYLVKNYGGNPTDKVVSLDRPGPTITTVPHESLVTTFQIRSNGGNPGDRVSGIEQPSGTLTTSPNTSIVSAAYFIQYNGKPDKSVFPATGPANTLTTKDRFAVIRPAFMVNNYGHDGQMRGASSLNEPSGTLTTVPKKSVVQIKQWIDNRTINGTPSDIEAPHPTLVTQPNQSIVSALFLDRQFGKSKGNSLDSPCGTITTEPKTNVVSVAFIMPTNYDNKPVSISQPHPTITAGRKMSYLINPSFKNGGSSIDKPCFTLVACMGKRPPLVVTIEAQQAQNAFDIPEEITLRSDFGQKSFYEDENLSPMLRIRVFMYMNGISDIFMRMLFIPELKRIQGLEMLGGPEYKLEGPKDQQKKFIGNSVIPAVVTDWILAYHTELFCNPVAEPLKLIARSVP